MYSGILTILEELKVGKVFIATQKEECSNYNKFIEIVNNKKIKVQKVKKGDRLKLENDLYIDVLWPLNKDLINDNSLNNNSLVLKLEYNNISCLFTGDIEEIAEQKLLKNTDRDRLKSTILKVAHHGSKTSTTTEFLKAVSPKIALIGVGANNKFGHPNEQVIERLKEMSIEVFRTDNDGEISIVVNRKGKIIKANKCVE